MTPQLLHAEVDYFQVAIIVCAVIFSFVKWLWDQWTGNKAETSEEAVEYSRQEELLRRLREQERRRAAGPQPPPVPPAPAAPWEEIRKAWKEVREAAQAQKQQPPQPAPAAQRRQAASHRPAVPAPPPPLAAPAPAAMPSAPPAVVKTSAETPMMASLRSLRRDPAELRRAIVLGEVLGPPKALQV